MKAWKLFLPGMLCLTLTACRTDPNVAVLERELRLQEDQIYQLQDCIDECEATLASCRRENEGLRRRLVSEPLRSFDYPTPSPPGARPPATAPARETPEPMPLPTINLPAAEVVPRPPASSPKPGGDGPSLGRGLTLGGPKPEVISGDSRQVARIELNKKLTGGYKHKNRAGHEGVLVVFEPRDEKGRIVAAPGDLNIVVVDPALPDELGRIARWDFAGEELAPLFQQKGLGPGFQIELPWPGEPPQHTDLHLFVRYATADGRQLQADKPLKVELAGDPQPPPGGNGPLLGRLSDRPAAAPPGPAEARPSPHVANDADSEESTPPKAPGPKRPVWSPERK